MVSTYGFAPGEAVSAAQLAKSGLLLAGEGTHVSPYAAFVPTDEAARRARSRSGQVAASGHMP